MTTPEYLGSTRLRPREPPRGDEAALPPPRLRTSGGRNRLARLASAAAGGGAWLIEGLTVHSGWSALRELKGRGVAQEYVETQLPQPVETPRAR